MSERKNENPGFTIRAAVIAVSLTLFLLASSAYIALKLGAQPWPIIFAVIVSGGIIKVLNRSGKVNIHEVNVAQAGASIGGLVAAGIVFTLPGIIYLNQTQQTDIAWPSPWILGILTALAGVLGLLLSIPLKYTFIDKEQLPYPAGTAGAELLKLGKIGGRQLAVIMILGSLAAIFGLLRDMYFPAGFVISFLATGGIFFTILPLPLALGGGYILGPKAGFSWFAGAVIGWGIIVPVLMNSGFDKTAARGVVQNLGMGLVLGAGIGFLASYVIPRLKSIAAPMLQSGRQYLKFYPLVSLIAIGGLITAEVPWLAAILTVLGVWLMVAVAARMTGETNIDPLEQFGIFVGLIIAMVYEIIALDLNMYASFMIVAFVSVACAVAGDSGHDYKSAAIVGTRFFDIVRVDLIAVVVAGFAAPFVLDIIHSGFKDQLFTPAMPAPQAKLVAGSIFGFAYPQVFIAGFAIAFVWEIINSFLPGKYKNRVLMMPLGIGLFLGLSYAFPIALGAAIRYYIDKNRQHLYHSGLLIAAGVMGGEGIAGFANAALISSGSDPVGGAWILIGIFAIVLLISFRLRKD